MRRGDIVPAARAWLGTRWQHQGRTGRGIDCVGLIVLVGRENGFAARDFRAYPRRPDGQFLPRFREQLNPRPVGKALPGDILVFCFGDAPCHCGFLSRREDTDTVIHAHGLRRRVVEEPLSAAASIVGTPSHAFAFPGVD